MLLLIQLEKSQIAKGERINLFYPMNCILLNELAEQNITAYMCLNPSQLYPSAWKRMDISVYTKEKFLGH